jgi:hypothetical protein
MVRGVLLTPWFAVSLGIVIATSLTLARPDPALTFPPSNINRCAAAGCSSPSAPSAPPAAPSPAIKHEIRLTGPRSDANVRVAGVKVEYLLMRGAHRSFIAVIALVSRRSLGDWELKFALPGGVVDHIMWATWRHDGEDGVVVTGSPLPWRGSGDNEARIVVFGTGAPRQPTGCELDGASCAFLAMPKHHADDGDFIRAGI